MKIEVINRTQRSCTKSKSGESHRLFRNPDPLLHPLHQSKELKRAINAAKLQRIFAKPFIAALPMDDAVTAISVNPHRLDCLLSGSADGTLLQWDVANRQPVRSFAGHTGAITGMSVTSNGESFVSCSADGTLKIFKLNVSPSMSNDKATSSILDFDSRERHRCLDHHWRDSKFATGGSVVEIWDHGRSVPVMQWKWGCDSVTSVKFNPVEVKRYHKDGTIPKVTSVVDSAFSAANQKWTFHESVALLGSTAKDRSVALYDLRSKTPIRKLIMQTRSNAMSWNPMEAMTFVCGNEDANVYTYDIRRLDAAQTVHKGFVSAVMDVDFSPTGTEFVAAGFDRTLRMFEKDASGSRDVYFAPRMSRVTIARFSRDGSYVYSGSEDMNVRMWKVRPEISHQNHP